MRKLALTLVPLVLLQASGAYALGVGDIELHSALNQPLNAEIRLLSATPAELQGLTVALAPEAAFAGAGVERLGLLTQLRFNVIQKSDGSHVIKVTSSQPIREPFLDFLVEVNWSSGRFVREYTVLLDFPVSDGGKPAPIEVPVSTPSPPVAPRLEASPAAHPQSQVEPSAPSPSPMAGNGTRKVAVRERSSTAGSSYGPTTRTDTLWKVAKEMRPDNSVSISQVMLALAKNNPHAFSTSNVNTLMAGYILRLPPMDAIHAVPQQEAAHEVAMQYQQWLGGQKGEVSPVRTESTPAVEKGGGGAQLKLITPDGGKTAVTTGGGAKAGAPDANDLASLRKDLAVALESVDTTRQENEELRTRLTMLEQQISSMQRLMNLKSGDLAALQNKAGSATATEAAAAKSVVSAPAVSSKPSVKPQPVKAPEAEQPVATDAITEITNNPQQLGMILGGFLLVSALLWTLVRRRRQAAIDIQEGAFAPQGRDKFASRAASASTPAIAPASVEGDDKAVPEAAMGLGDAHVIHADEDVIDPLAEADVYLAYRRYDQAESLIKEAMRQDPGRHELALKLLEIYHATKNADAFETQAETLYATLGGEGHPLWHKVVEMGKQVCPGHPLFGKAAPEDMPDGAVIAGIAGVGAAAIAGADAFYPDQNASAQHLSDFSLPDAQAEGSYDSSAAGEMDFSELELGMPAGQDAVLEAAVQPASADNSIDFDFGFSEQASVDAAPSQMEEHLPADALLDNSLDFDLSLSGAINNLSQEVNSNSVVDDVQEVAENASSVFLLDEQDTSEASNTITSMGMEENLDAELEAIQLATAEEPASILETASDLAFNLEGNSSVDHDFGLLAQETGEAAEAVVSKEPADDWDLEAALSAFDGTAPEDVPTQEADDDLFAGIDMVGTKLDLAKAYIDMEDQEGARVLLNEVLDEGDDSQKQEAQELMQQIA
ncbi:MAG: hypothetical protein M3A44_10835 [Gammaproteobacteria bacterium]